VTALDEGRWFPDAMPSPAADAETRPFWEACRERRLVVQRCASCGTWRHPPRPVCPTCASAETTWEEVPGTGTIYSYAVVHQALHPALREHVPYGVVLVTLDGTDGVRLASNLVGSPAEAAAVDARVAVAWEDMSPELTLPRFRLATPG
jgi:uncharacterized OB-fold protein